MNDNDSRDAAPNDQLNADGERFLPGVMHGQIELEHLHRYYFAAQFVSQKDVLDIACGEGYGSALLSRSARGVIGVDIAEGAVEHARSTYQLPRLEFKVGSCSEIPVEDTSVDVIVSFETIEHHVEHERMMMEFKRVLRPGGLLVISSPDRFHYSDKPSFRNPFHVRELYRKEFESLLTTYFRYIGIQGQRILFGSSIFGETNEGQVSFEALKSGRVSYGQPADPVYLVALASDDPLPTISGSLLEGVPGAANQSSTISQSESDRSRGLTRAIKLIASRTSQSLCAALHSPWYLERNPDITQEGSDPVTHWWTYGADEGRVPASDVLSLLSQLVSERDARAVDRVALIEERSRIDVMSLEQRFSEHLQTLQSAIASNTEGLRLAKEAVRRAQDETSRALTEGQQRVTKQLSALLLLAQDDRRLATQAETRLLERLVSAQSMVQERFFRFTHRNIQLVSAVGAAVIELRSKQFWRKANPIQPLVDLIRGAVVDAPFDVDLSTDFKERRRPVATPIQDHISSELGNAETVGNPPEAAPTIVPATSVGELLMQEGAAFVSCAYITLLGRTPDAEGYLHYISRMQYDGDKLAIIDSLCTCDEGRKNRPKLSGLRLALLRHRFVSLPGIRQFSNRKNHRLRIDELLIGALNRAVKDIEISDGIGPSSVRFDANWYLTIYPDVTSSGLSPLDHYVQYGRAKGRLPSQFALEQALIDKDAYRRANPDVATASIDPWEHYLSAGWREGRSAGIALELLQFDPDWYFRHNPDVTATGVNPLRHFVDGGILQNRSSSSFRGLSHSEPEPRVYFEPPNRPEVKLIAFYHPQYQPTPDRNKRHGKEIINLEDITSAKAFYVNHDQPRTPSDLGIYVLGANDSIRLQAELARSHGVHGFCIHFDWFGGRRLFCQPLFALLQQPDIEINFCLCWANEHFSYGGNGLDNEISTRPEHTSEEDIAFIAEVSKAFEDPRYIRVGGKPLLVVYRPDLLTEGTATIERWRSWCRHQGLGEIHICYTRSSNAGGSSYAGMDATIEFPPATSSVQEITKEIPDRDPEFFGKIHSYLFAAKAAAKYTRPSNIEYRGVMPSWDNTALEEERSVSFYGATPDLYAEWLNHAANETCRSLEADHRLVFINAWNGWAEGAYLEPDRRRGFAYLNRTREVVATYSQGMDNEGDLLTICRATSKIAVVVHLHHGDLFDTIAGYLRDSPEPFDLYFSVRDGSFGEMRKVILARFPNATVVSYPNRGRDVLPFLRIMYRIRHFGYDAICKIHSKKSQHRTDGHLWREDVLEKLLGGGSQMESCIQRTRDGVGVLAPAGHMLSGATYCGSNVLRVTELAARMGCPAHWLDDFYFPAGTMFWCQPRALSPLLDLNMQSLDFEVEAGQVDGTTAHAVERLVGLSARKVGLALAPSRDRDKDDSRPYQFAVRATVQGASRLE